MNRRITGILILVLIGYAEPMFGQHEIKLAEKHFYAEDYDLALKEYNELLKSDPQNELVLYRVEICSLLTDYRGNDIDRLLSFGPTQGKKDKFYNYWLGRAYFRQYQFEKALNHWNKFLASSKYKSPEIMAETKEFITWADEANLQFTHPDNYEIDCLSPTVNTHGTEYSPVYFKEKEELLFLSSMHSSTGVEQFQVYGSYKKMGAWSVPEPQPNLGYFTRSNANIEVVDQNRKLYLYRGHLHGELFYGKNQGTTWSDPQLLDEQISHSKMESHFFINESENRVLFAHRTSNSSGLDIYESRKDARTAKWTKPTLLSENISSNKNEDFPFLTLDEKTLYFSSTGFESIGGYDIFRSDYDESSNTWSKPISLKYPTNTPDDDIQFKINKETNSGYFVSDRYGSAGSFDIYFFHEAQKILLSGVVIDAAGIPADHATVEILPSRPTGLAIYTATDENGHYKASIGENDVHDIKIYFHDKLVHTEEFNSPQLDEFNQPKAVTKNFNIGTKKVAQPIEEVHDDDPVYSDMNVIGSKFRNSKKAKIKNIYFDFDQYYLRWEDRPLLDPLVATLLANPDVKIEIGGHTDKVGEAQMNLRISLLRAQSVARYLVESGVASDRVSAKGYGYEMPIASNDQELEGRELNRRIEVVVLE